MSFDDEGERLEDEYHNAVKDAQVSEAFYGRLTSGKPVSLTVDSILEVDRLGNPDWAWRRAMHVLDTWRAYRAAHGRP